MEATLKNHIIYIYYFLILFLYLSDLQAQWQPAEGLQTGHVRSIQIVGNTIYAGTTDGLFRSTDNGLSWSILFSHEWCRSFPVIGKEIYVNTLSGGNFYRSLDDGATWNLIATGWNFKNYSAADDSCLFVVANASGGVWRSADKGITWEKTGLDDVNGLVFMNNYLFAATYYSVQRTRDRGQNWQSANNGFDHLEITSLVSQNGRLYAAVSYGSPRRIPPNFYVSNNNGDSWDLLAKGTEDHFSYW